MTTNLPASKQIDKHIAREATIQGLGDEEHVRHQGSVQNDGNVGGVEQLDGVVLLSTLVPESESGQKK